MTSLSHLPTLADRPRQPCPKGKAGVIAREEAAEQTGRIQRAVLAAVRKRDGKICRVPDCKKPSTHSHHIVYRSLGGAWTTQNMLRLCTKHHQYVHAGILKIHGDADKTLVWEGRT